jgi:hypothetical protein
MGKKLMQEVLNSTPTVDVGVDIGYGWGKAVSVAHSVSMPDVYGAARDLRYGEDDLTAKYAGDQITDDEGDWFVGELALKHLKPAHVRRLRGRTADEETLGNVVRVRLLKALLGKLFAGVTHGDAVHLRLATGLPVSHMADAGLLKRMLLNEPLHVHTSSAHFVAHISQVYVMPQPYGTIYANMLTADGRMNPAYAYNTTGVVDVGTYTIDATRDDDGDYIDAQSDSVEAGLHIVQEALRMWYEREFGATPSLGVLDTLIQTGCLKWRGEIREYSAQVAQAVHPLIDATLNLMGELWGKGGDLDVIYLTGGGAYLVSEAVRAVYPHAVVMPEGYLANATGYLRFALWKANA